METLPGHAKNLPGGLGEKTHPLVWVHWYVEAYPWSAVLLWSRSGGMLRGKGLEDLDMDVVLPLAHLEGEVAMLRLMTV